MLYKDSDGPIFWDKQNRNYNADKRLSQLRTKVEQLINSTQSDDIFLTFGCDFAYSEAHINYESMDNMIEAWNKMYPDVQMQYSTPSNYLQKVKNLKMKEVSSKKQEHRVVLRDLAQFQSTNDTQLLASLSSINIIHKQLPSKVFKYFFDLSHPHNLSSFGNFTASNLTVFGYSR